MSLRLVTFGLCRSSGVHVYANNPENLLAISCYHEIWAVDFLTRSLFSVDA